MRFLIDIHHIGTRATGNETWASEVSRGLKHLVARANARDELVFGVATPCGRAFAAPDAAVSLARRSARRLLWDLPLTARRERVDALLVQYTTPPCSSPRVVAIHDLSFADPSARHWIPRGERARMQATIRWSARRADRILALSRHTANDLQSRWSIEPERIVVAYPAVGAARAARLREHSRDPERPREGPLTVLAVGNVLPRKNLVVLVRAVGILRGRGLPVVLKIVGQVPRAGRGVRAELVRLSGDWLTISGYVPEDGLIAAYHEADVFCFPSLYEGFGLPVLEAMTAGVPTIVSDSTALPEAAGDAGTVVAPNEPGAWADALEKVLTDKSEASRMRARGRVHAARFSWDDTAATVLAALRAVAS